MVYNHGHFLDCEYNSRILAECFSNHYNKIIPGNVFSEIRSSTHQLIIYNA